MLLLQSQGVWPCLACKWWQRPCILWGLFSVGDNCWWGFTRAVTFTESQNGWGGKGPLKVIWSDPCAQAWLPRAGCPGPCRRVISIVGDSILVVPSHRLNLQSWLLPKPLSRQKLTQVFIQLSELNWSTGAYRSTRAETQGRHQDCPAKRRGGGATYSHNSKLLHQVTHLVKCHLKRMRQKLTVQKTYFFVERFVLFDTLKPVLCTVAWSGIRK